MSRPKGGYVHGLFYDGISSDEYHGIVDRLSPSGAKMLNKAPALYKHEKIDGGAPKTTKALDDGKKLHIYTLQPHLIQEKYFILQEGFNGTTKAGKAGLKKIAEQGLQPIKHEENLMYQGIADAVWNHKYASRLLRGGLIEQSVFWDDFITNCPCKARLDLARPDLGIAADLKGMADGSFKQFRKSISTYRYHCQAAHNLAGANTTGVKYEKFLFIVVEKKPPYLVAVYELDEASIKRGQQAMEADYRTFVDAMESGVWPGYDEKIRLIDAPDWG